MHSVAPLILGLTAPFPLTNGAIGCLTAASASGLLNLLWLMPWTRKIKEKRWDVQKKYTGEELEKYDAPLRKEFGKSHGLSLLFNFSHVLGMLGYGIFLTRGLLHFIPK